VIFYLSSLFNARGLIFLPLELFRLVIGCTIIVNSSMKFKIIHKISVIQEKCLVLHNLLSRAEYNTFGGRFLPAVRGLCIPLHSIGLSADIRHP